MEYQNWRYLSLLWVSNNIDICPTLEKEIDTDYLIIWWWVAWLHAAQALISKKHSVTLIEKSICGWGMSWRSGWFLTPDSELWLRQIEEIYGQKLAKKIRAYGSDGQQSIVKNIKEHDLICDLRQEDSLLLGLGKSWKRAVAEEHADRKKFWLKSELIDAQSLKDHNSWQCYTAGVRYTDCYAINPMQYCQELKQKLIKRWVKFFEFTHVHKLDKHYAKTNLWWVTFKKAILCTWKAEEDIFPGHAKHTYGIQNYITISEPLHRSQVMEMMPSGDCMCRDTNLVFTYYRLTWDRRIVLGWWTPFSSFQPRDIFHAATISSVIRSFKKTFPSLSQVAFPHYRSGRIEASKDLMPLVGPSQRFDNHIRVQGAVWLPRAAASGRFAAEILHEEADRDLQDIFSYERKFTYPRMTNNILLKPFLFGISNAKAMGMF